MAKHFKPYNKLKGLRTSKGLSAGALAAKIGIAGSTYWRKERRYEGADFTVSECKSIAKILGGHPSEIFFVDEVSNCKR